MFSWVNMFIMVNNVMVFMFPGVVVGWFMVFMDNFVMVSPAEVGLIMVDNVMIIVLPGKIMFPVRV